MKVRTGFVSNSSSSSFCIYGTILSSVSNINEETDEKIENDAYEFFQKAGLEYYNDDYDSYIGLSYTDIKDDETGAQFKQRVVDLLKATLGADIEVMCSAHEGE